MRQVRLGAEAEAEFAAAADWYETQQPGLKADFVDAVRAVLAKVALFPAAGAPLRTRGPAIVRRMLVPRFPFAIVYVDDASAAVVIAVAHTSRKPGYWVSRSGRRS